MNPFELLGIEPRFDIDFRAIERRHRELSRALHPDRFVNAGAAEKRLALGKAVDVNEAWRIVRDSVRRAEALFDVAGIPVGEDREPKTPPGLLLEVMELREELGDARAANDTAKLEQMRIAIAERVRTVESELARLFSSNPSRDDLVQRIALLGSLRFAKRLESEVVDALESQ